MDKKNERKRGRPAGKDRMPLSKEERRARNAQYERERRNEHAEAVAELFEASEFDPGMSFENLLRHVCCYFKTQSRRPTEESVASLRQINSDLLQKIEQTEASLSAPTPPQSPTENEDTCIRTRPFVYVRKVKRERVSIESSKVNNLSIKTEVEINDKLAKTTEPPAYVPVTIKTEGDIEIMADQSHKSSEVNNRPIKTEGEINNIPAQITEAPANAPVKIKTEVKIESMTFQSQEMKSVQDHVKGSRPNKKRKLDHNNAVAVHTKANPVNVPSTSKTQCMLVKPATELKTQDTEQCRPLEKTSQKTQADSLILGLFTEEMAKYDIVQYYIKLLVEEGYDGGANISSSSDRSDPQIHADTELRTTYQV